MNNEIEQMGPEVTTISLHIGQMVAGQMCTSVSSVRQAVKMYLSVIGVDIVSDNHLIKTIPYSNVQGIDYAPIKK